MAKINGIVQDPSGEVTRIFDRYSQFPLKQKQQHLIKRSHSIVIFTCPSKSQSAHTKALNESTYFFGQKNIFFDKESNFLDEAKPEENVVELDVAVIGLVLAGPLHEVDELGLAVDVHGDGKLLAGKVLVTRC